MFEAVLEGGTLISSAVGCGRLPVLPACGRGPESPRVRVVVGTLLGPERAGPFPRGGVDRCFSVQGRSASHTARCPEGRVWVWWGRVAGVWSYVENCTVDASIFRLWFCRVLVGPHDGCPSGRWLCGFLCGQVVKGARWMPWHQEPMKDVGGCDKPRGAVNRALIRGFPNGGTPHQSCGVTRA